MITFSAVPEDSKDFAGLLAEVSSYTRSESRHLFEPLVIKGWKLITKLQFNMKQCAEQNFNKIPSWHPIKLPVKYTSCKCTKPLENSSSSQHFIEAALRIKI